MNRKDAGIYDALKREVLSAVCMTIVADAAQPDKVLETYTFQVCSTGELTLDLDVQGSGSRTLRTGVVQQRVADFICDLATLCEQMPQLPSTLVSPRSFEPGSWIRRLTSRQKNAIFDWRYGSRRTVIRHTSLTVSRKHVNTVNAGLIKPDGRGSRSSNKPSILDTRGLRTCQIHEINSDTDTSQQSRARDLPHALS